MEQRSQKKEQLEQLRKAYTLASINNDIKMMRRIVNILGYPPIKGGKGGGRGSYYKIYT